MLVLLPLHQWICKHQLFHDTFIAVYPWYDSKKAETLDKFKILGSFQQNVNLLGLQLEIVYQFSIPFFNLVLKDVDWVWQVLFVQVFITAAQTVVWHQDYLFIHVHHLELVQGLLVALRVELIISVLQKLWLNLKIWEIREADWGVIVLKKLDQLLLVIYRPEVAHLYCLGLLFFIWVRRHLSIVIDCQKWLCKGSIDGTRNEA